MKGETKCLKWGGFGSLKVAGNSTNQQSTYEFLLKFHSNYAPILHIFIYSENRRLNLTYPPLFGAPVWGDPIGILHRF